MSTSESALPSRQDIEFQSSRALCRGWLYQATPPQAPLIIMANGFGGTRDMFLEQFAQHFVQAGLAVLIFDYQTFGASEGSPRNYVHPKQQLADWHAAIAFVRAQPASQNRPIILWGTSFSGGAVMVAAVQDGHIAATIHMNPMMDGLASAQAMRRHSTALVSAKVSAHVIADFCCSLIGIGPRYIPIFAPPGTVGAETTDDAWQAFSAFPDTDFDNRVTARSLLSVPRFRPTKLAAKLSGPALFQICRQDTVAPAIAARKAATLTPQAETIEYDAGHFDVYGSPLFEQCVQDQLKFLSTHGFTR